MLADRNRRQSPEMRAFGLMEPGSYPLWDKKFGTRDERLERVKRDYLTQMMTEQGDTRPGKDHAPWDDINYPLSDMKPRPGLWAEDPMKGLPAMLRRQRKHQGPRQQQPRPSDAEFLKMWEGRNQMLQQQRGREGERREFEKGRPMLPSGASDIQRPTAPPRPTPPAFDPNSPAKFQFPGGPYPLGTGKLARSNVRLMSATFGDKTYAIPTMTQGRQLSNDAAVAYARQQGLEKYPAFGSVEQAEGWIGGHHGDQAPPRPTPPAHETVYAWEEKVQRAEEALRAAGR
jgi:hypothetical protein